jgi:hypothetical protein
MNYRAAAWLIMLTLTFSEPIGAAELHAESAASEAGDMQIRYDALRDQLDDNQFEQPICLNSNLKDERISGELNGVILHSFETARAAFRSARNWCEIMMLHLNVKSCHASENGSDHTLTVFVGGKQQQPLDSAYCGEYGYRVLDDRPDYFRVALSSDRGPLQTRNYRIVLEAVPIEHEQTFIHFSYSYDFGTLARTLKSIYFQTVGHDKVGFTVVDNGSDNRPVYIGGVRGALERNIMRFYLAMKAYLGALSVPPSERLEKRLQDWFALTERYPLQLRELDKEEYLRMKRQEHQRQAPNR